jgi:polysaccharide export outer membrane protein
MHADGIGFAPLRRMSRCLLLIVATGLTLAEGRAAAQSAPVPATTAAAPARGVTTNAASPEYRIGTGDKLQINVYKETDLSPALQVRPDGRITMPLIGDLVAAGQTPMQLQRRLAESLKEFVANPVVTVMVTEVAERVVYVMGEVSQPGAIPMKSNMTVLQALAVAGGLKDFADSKNIRILRKGGVTGPQTITFNYKDAIKGTGAALMYLQAGDTVVVPD